MKLLKQLSIMALSLATHSLCSQTILINQGSPISPDGQFQHQEWTDANSFVFTINSNRSTRVYYKHDGQHLNIAFAGSLQTGGTYFPELMIDPNNSDESNIQSNDWWFHVSATDCEYQGQYGNYNNCQGVRPNWKAAPNFQQGRIVDTVEIQIPFSTLGIQANDTIGIGFLLNNFQSILKYPSGSSHLNPSSWSNAILSMTTSIEQSHQKSFLQVFPNPSDGQIQLNWSNDIIEPSFLILRNVLGEEVKRIVNPKSSQQLDLSHLEKGIYFIAISSDKEQISKKIILK